MDENKTPILILGTGAEARMALDIANELDVLVYGFIASEDDKVYKELNDVLIVAQLGTKDSETLLTDEKARIVVAEADVQTRQLIAEQIKDEAEKRVINAIHPQNAISPYAKIGGGNLIYPGAVIGPNVLMGNFNLLGAYVSVGADTHIGDYCTIQDGVRIGKGAVIADETFIGMGAIINPGVEIGAEVMIAPGSVVLQDVPEKSTVFGNPAKITNQ